MSWKRYKAKDLPASEQIVRQNPRGLESCYLFLDSSMSLLHVPLLPGRVQNKLGVLLKHN